MCVELSRYIFISFALGKLVFQLTVPGVQLLLLLIVETSESFRFKTGKMENDCSVWSINEFAVSRPPYSLCDLCNGN